MPLMNPFDSIVTATKRNNRYYGPTESEKMASFLTEVAADFNTIFTEINNIRTSIEAVASGFLLSSSLITDLGYMKQKTYELEGRLNSMIFTQSQQVTPSGVSE